MHGCTKKSKLNERTKSIYDYNYNKLFEGLKNKKEETIKYKLVTNTLSIQDKLFSKKDFIENNSYLLKMSYLILKKNIYMSFSHFLKRDKMLRMNDCENTSLRNYIYAEFDKHDNLKDLINKVNEDYWILNIIKDNRDDKYKSKSNVNYHHNVLCLNSSASVKIILIYLYLNYKGTSLNNLKKVRRKDKKRLHLEAIKEKKKILIR